MRAWLLPLLFVSAVTGLAVCQSVWAAPGAAPPCTTATCPPVKVALPPPPPPSPTRPKVWAGLTRSEAIMEFKVLSGRPPDFHVPGIKTAHAQCQTFRAWKVWVVPSGYRWYIIDEKKNGYWVTPYAPAAGCHP